MESKKRILILINQRTSEADRNWYFFHDKVTESIGADTNVEVTMGDMSQLSLELSAHDSKVYDQEAGWSLGDFDLVVFRFIRREHAVAGACALFLQRHNIPYIDTQIKALPYSKFIAQAIRQNDGMTGIPSFYAKPAIVRRTIVEDTLPFAYPVIIKDNNGRKGRLNFIAYNKDEALKILDENEEVEFILQAFIPNEGDYRILVIGGEPKLAIYRQAAGESHLNNTSQGGSSQVVPVESIAENVMADVVRAAKLENLQIAGVDLMFDSVTGQHYILEVNSSPQLATGAVTDLKLKAYTDYLVELANGRAVD